MNRLREGGIADASAKICRPRRSPTTMSSSPTATIRRVVAGMRSKVGCRSGKTSPGMIATRARGVGSAAWGSEDSAAICAARLAPAEWPIRANRFGIGPDVAHPDAQHPHRVVDRRHRVGQEVLRHRADVVLIPGEDHHMAVADQVVDPGAVEPRIDGEPAVEEHHHRRLIRPGPVGLEEPVGPGPLADLVAPDAAMRRLGLVATRPVLARRALAPRLLAGLQPTAVRPSRRQRRKQDQGRRHPAAHPQRTGACASRFRPPTMALPRSRFLLRNDYACLRK